MHEGLHNTPRLYGSSVRDKGKVTDFESGVKEGGKVGTFGSHAEMAR
jgi:sterol 3beta-glucosyltransferase